MPHGCTGQRTLQRTPTQTITTLSRLHARFYCRRQLLHTANGAECTAPCPLWRAICAWRAFQLLVGVLPSTYCGALHWARLTYTTRRPTFIQRVDRLLITTT